MGNCKSINTKNGNRKITLAIVGLDNAGKTVTTKSLLGESVQTTTPTIGFSSVSFEFEKHNVTLFDLGGGRNIRGIWKKYFAEVYGIIYVVDASAQGRLRECREVLDKLLQEEMVRGKPMLLLANKQDVKGALDEEELCAQLRLNELVNKYKTPCRVESCSAVSRSKTKKLDDSIQNGFHWLLEQIDNSWERLNKRIEGDVGHKQNEEMKNKEERTERVRRSRELREKEELSTGSLRNDDDYDVNDGRNPFKPIKQTLLSSQKKDTLPNSKILSTSVIHSDDKYRRDLSLRPRGLDKDDDLYPSSSNRLTSIRRTSIDDDLYKYPARATPATRLKPIESRDNDRYTSSNLTNQRKLKPLDEDDSYNSYSGGRGTNLNRGQLVPISSTRGRRDDSDRDSDDDYRPVTRNGVRATARIVTPPPLTLAKYGSLEGLSGRRSSALSPIDTKKPKSNQTAPLDTPRSYYDTNKPPSYPSSTKPTSSLLKSSQPSRLDRLDENENTSFARKWNLADLPDSDDDDDYRPKSRGPVRASRPNGDYHRNDYR